MYKVFLNDRIVFLNSVKNLPVFDHKYHINITSHIQFKSVIKQFINDNTINQLYIYHESVEKLFKQFEKLFHKKIIAAGGIVKNNKDETLCIFRLGKWDLPKGKVEKEERIDLAAIREVEEECGITAPIIENFNSCTYHIYFSPYHDNAPILKETWWYNMYYEGNEELTPQKSEDITKAKWLNHKKRIEASQNTYESLKDLYLNAKH